MARPAKPGGEQLRHAVIFRMTDAEFEQFRHQAERAGMRPNELARILTLSRSNQVTINTHAISDPAMLRRLERIGRNLNQLIHNAHIFGRVSPQVAELAERVTEIIEQTAAKEWNE